MNSFTNWLLIFLVSAVLGSLLSIVGWDMKAVLIALTGVGLGVLLTLLVEG